MRKTVAAATMAASLTLGGAAGAVLFVPSLSGAQTDQTPTDETAGEESRDHDGFLADALAPLVTDGTITQAQADAVIQTLREARPERAFGHHGFHAAQAVLDVLGIDADALRDALADGQTLAEIAEANGVTAQAVIDAMVGEAEERLDQAVDDGRLTEEEAGEKLAEITGHITGVVNGDIEPHLGRRGPGGHRFGGRGGEPPADQPSDS